MTTASEQTVTAKNICLNDLQSNSKLLFAHQQKWYKGLTIGSQGSIFNPKLSLFRCKTVNESLLFKQVWQGQQTTSYCQKLHQNTWIHQIEASGCKHRSICMSVIVQCGLTKKKIHKANCSIYTAFAKHLVFMLTYLYDIGCFILTLTK